MRKQRILLIDHANVAGVRRDIGQIMAVHIHTTAVGDHKSRDHAQGSRLATPAGAEEGEKLPLADIEGEMVDRYQPSP